MLSKTEIIDILAEWNFWGKGVPTGIPRDSYVNEILSFLKGVNKVIGVYGVRRAGKSFILRQVASRWQKENVLYVNFEETRFPEKMDKNFLLRIIDSYKEIVNPKEKPLIILDEVQEVDGWEKVVRSLHERDYARFIVSGSSAKLMAEELETLLAGRIIKKEVFPLSFEEFIRFKNLDKRELLLNKEKRMSILTQYMKEGGFPEISLESSYEKKREIMNSYWDTIIIKDVKKRFKIRKDAELEAIGRFLLANPASLISFRKIGNTLGIPFKTVERFFKYFELARLVLALKKFSWKALQQERSQKKSYLIDIGFFTFSGYNFSKNIGKIMENLVAIELLRRHREVYYWKDYQGKEVDFVVKEGARIKQLIQVTYVSSKDEIEQREIKALLKASDLLKCKNLLVITWDYESEEKIENKKIKFIPLWKWLLG